MLFIRSQGLESHALTLPVLGILIRNAFFGSLLACSLDELSTIKPLDKSIQDITAATKELQEAKESETLNKCLSVGGSGSVGALLIVATLVALGIAIILTTPTVQVAILCPIIAISALLPVSGVGIGMYGIYQAYNQVSSAEKKLKDSQEQAHTNHEKLRSYILTNYRELKGKITQQRMNQFNVQGGVDRYTNALNELEALNQFYSTVS